MKFISFLAITIGCLNAKIQSLAQVAEVDFDPAVDDSQMTNDGKDISRMKVL